MRSITTHDRRARIGQRHRLAHGRRADRVDEIVRDLVVLHATDPASVYLSAWARLNEASLAAVDDALYVERSVVRMLSMRRTMFVVTTDEVPMLHAAASMAVARRERKRNEDLAALLDIGDVKSWLREAETDTLRVLHEQGESSATELSALVPALQRKVRVNAGRNYEGDIGMSSRVLIVLALEGRIVRGRPRGTWRTSAWRRSPPSTSRPSASRDSLDQCVSIRASRRRSRRNSAPDREFLSRPVQTAPRAPWPRGAPSQGTATAVPPARLPGHRDRSTARTAPRTAPLAGPHGWQDRYAPVTEAIP